MRRFKLAGATRYKLGLTQGNIFSGKAEVSSEEAR